MTEEDWLTGRLPRAMLEALDGGASARKLRLFACACCRRAWGLLPDVRSRRAVEVAEEFADGQVGDSARVAAADDAGEAVSEWGRQLVLGVGEDGLLRLQNREVGVRHAASTAAWYAAYYRDEGAAEAAADALEHIAAAVCDNPNARWDDELSEDHPQCELLRCIFGNPFRPSALDQAWRTSTVRALANLIYTERAFERLPILAEALKEAGCDNTEMLAHCRSTGPHARGCWVVDFALGQR